jgi:hypothetical protein
MPHGSNPELKPTDRTVHNELEEKTMKMKRFLSICGVALLLGIGGISSNILAGEREVKPSQESATALSVEPQKIVNESIAQDAVDVYRLSCTASTSTCARADVWDIGPFNDTHFSVCVVGVNGGLAGKGRCDISPQGGRSPVINLCKSATKKGPFTAYVVISMANRPGPEPENYNSFQSCSDSSFNEVSHSLTKTQDQ